LQSRKTYLYYNYLPIQTLHLEIYPYNALKYMEVVTLHYNTSKI
jgi:hypothetical protein